VSGVLLVTGGSRGIGAACARLAGQRGYTVCVNYHRSLADAEGVVSDIRASGAKAMAVSADAATEEGVRRLFEVIDRELGPLSALVWSRSKRPP
jgi:NAD(P)-dependent dehydrogenase (short-subunit alcohol dehydrogenase family)